MVKQQRYQSILDEYLSQVATVTREFEEVLKEQTELIRELAKENASKSGDSADPIQVDGALGAGKERGSRDTQIPQAFGVDGGRRRAGSPGIFDEN